MRRGLQLVVGLALLAPLAPARADEARPSALDLALEARPSIAGSLSAATRAVLSQISAEEAAALARGEIRLAELLLPDGTPIAHFLASVLGSGPYAVPFYSLDAGGGESAGGSFRLLGTIGQPDAAVLAAGSGSLLVGGFRGRLERYGLFVDGFETGDTSRWSSVQ